jgi:hypothetical protein
MTTALTRFSAADLAHHFAKSRRRKKAKRKTRKHHADAALFGALFGAKKKSAKRSAAAKRAYLKRKREGTLGGFGESHGAKKRSRKKGATRRYSGGGRSELSRLQEIWIKAQLAKEGINVGPSSEKRPTTLRGIEALVTKQLREADRKEKEAEARAKEKKKISALISELQTLDTARRRRGRKPGPKKGSHHKRRTHKVSAAAVRRLLGR